MVLIAVFVSGRGSNFQAIDTRLSSMEDPPAAVTLCVSNNPNPGAFDYARDAGIETLRLSPKMFESEEEYDRELLAALRERGIEMILLAGYMRRLPPGVVEGYRGRILNIHPALLPKFGGKGMYGLHVHEAVLASGEAESGVTIHLVDGEYDTGAIVAQERVPVLDGDTPDTLASRVLEVEHRLYPHVVIEWAEKLLKAEGDSTLTDGEKNEDQHTAG